MKAIVAIACKGKNSIQARIVQKRRKIAPYDAKKGDLAQVQTNFLSKKSKAILTNLPVIATVFLTARLRRK